ncbi:hypothetical protein CAL12_18765 [Bordetella genomosp. 8]|uniref:Phosphoribosyl-dephospho-CoA transferase n=1 Tax=Bordetella genomosp. 8 TaxID=1416806 RepID=A0A1W6YNG3_9BORD|nr:malonate decarboxylase holo-ACP synthase [Bordetella genomosp. 8]ARP82656.1 hypothetical protein CAL12_18765 [Bordetella genomosp. 8]
MDEMSFPRPHDLLWLSRPPMGALPGWLRLDWPVVVRRDHGPGRIPIGLRGEQRSQRLAAWTDAGDVKGRVVPEQLALEARLRGHAQAMLPCLLALDAVAPRLDGMGVSWGPTGSVGFALATGVPLLRPDSDLDIRIDAPARLDADQKQGLAELARHAGCRLDIQIETVAGGFSLAEWLADRGEVLLKTNRGPVMVTDPWNHPCNHPWNACQSTVADDRPGGPISGGAAA